jgi:hypothetical protein
MGEGSPQFFLITFRNLSLGPRIGLVCMQVLQIWRYCDEIPLCANLSDSHVIVLYTKEATLVDFFNNQLLTWRVIPFIISIFGGLLYLHLRSAIHINFG